MAPSASFFPPSAASLVSKAPFGKDGSVALHMPYRRYISFWIDSYTLFLSAFDIIMQSFCYMWRQKQSHSNGSCINFLIPLLIRSCGLSGPAKAENTVTHSQIGNTCNLIYQRLTCSSNVIRRKWIHSTRTDVSQMYFHSFIFNYLIDFLFSPIYTKCFQ